ncbi:hypothetical protein [Streptomyces bobili]|uniref:hypothetical protein n=1 Tax=Streptomyces bobili TaxID=67280 RepID=UPI0038259407
MDNKQTAGSGITLCDQVVTIWAQALFCSSLEPSDHPDPVTVCVTVATELAAFEGQLGGCTGAVAQVARDHPELFAERMSWCLKEASHAYAVL